MRIETWLQKNAPEPAWCVASSARSFTNRLWADERGVAALEFALLLPVLVTILLATADLALVAVRSFQVQSLAQATASAIAGLHGIPAAPAGQGIRNGALPNAVSSALPKAWSLGGIVQTHALLVDGVGLPKITIATLVALPADAKASSILFWGCSMNAQLLSVRMPVCPDGSRAAAYAEVIVRAPVNRLVSWPDSLLANAVEARAVVRLG